LRAMLSNDNYWEILRESTEAMMADPLQKNVLEKDYPYELSLLSITMLEFDRSKFYLEKFKDKFLKDWAGVRDFSGLKTKIEIVSELLRQQELKDFLYNTKHYHVEGLAGSPDLERFYETVNNWTKRKSSGILDNFSYLSDSYNSRCLFIDIMKNKYQEYGSDLYNSHHVKISLEYIKGLLKMGYIDTADRIMSKSYGRKEKYLPNDTTLDYDFASIFIQSKLDGFERDANFITRVLDESSINIKFINTRFSKINQIMDFWMKKKNNTANVQFEENINFSLLNLKTKIKEMDAIKDYLGPNCEEEVSNQYLKLLHESMDIAKDKISKLEARENNLLVELDNTSYKSKILKKASNLTENVLRWYKIKAENAKISLKQYAEQERKIAIVDLARNFIKYTSGLCAQGKIIPSKVLFVLEMTSEFSSELGTLFWDCFKTVPTWIFLKWLPQIMSFMNFDSGEAFIPLITKMAVGYPEPVYYAMSVTTDFSTIFGKQNRCISMLCDIMDRHFGKEWTHHKFVRSMEWMLHPDQRVKTWMDCIDENVAKKANLEVIRNRMIKDVFTIEDEILGDNIGEFNRKFIKDMEKYVKVLFGDDFAKLTSMNQKELLNNTKELFLRADGYCKGKSVAFTTSTYKTKLSNFAGWLNDYDINNYRRQNLRIEIPGQYSGDSEPIPELNIKVSYFLPEILVIQSIRKPKRLTMLGSDEKVYHSLVKGGEDLRLDQRIEQIFGIMNDIFGKDPECSKREFNIGTFNVTPVKKGLGVMEWVKNTIPLKSVMEKEITTKEDLLNNKAYYRRQALLKSLSKSKDIREQHVALLGAPREVIVKDFNNQLGYFRADLLKFAIKKKVSNAEQYVKLRKVFLSNYAVLSLGSYILGVGDRHLDNFLFDFVQGKIIPIDFGYSFGFGIGLYIPEMMPFRMTQNFVELTYPLGLEGIYRNSMIFALKALKDHKHLLVDTCEVFIRDPLLDWIKMARGKVTNGTSQMLEMEANIYPRDKLKVVQMKLNGYNPVTVMLSEMENTRHKEQPYTGQLFQTVRGASHRPRAAMAGGILPLCDQVDALLDMSIDPDILGRAWSGWAPYA
jgi:DNA-dependent protein kinase catalytic subunit